MKEKLKQHLEGIFAEAPDTQENRDLKEEFYANLCDRYDEAIAEGRSENEAYMISVKSLGDIHTLLGIEDKKETVFTESGTQDPRAEEKQRKEEEQKRRYEEKLRIKRMRKARRAVKGPAFLLTLIVYFILSFVTGGWAYTWIIFLINIAVNVLIDGIFELKEATESK